MALSKHKIEEFVKIQSIKCNDPIHLDVKGINIEKKFMSSRNVGSDTSKYLVVPPNSFACNLMHVGRDEKIPVALNNNDKDLVVSPAYFVFLIENEDLILRQYFYIILSSKEFDRFACFCTDSSIRGNLEWKRFCEIELELPDIPTQQKYVDIYNGLQKNIEVYESGIEDLQKTCRIYINNVKENAEKVLVGKYIEAIDERNINNHNYEHIGINRDKQFMSTMANTKSLDATKYKIIRKKSFVFSGMQTGRDRCIRIGLYLRNEPALISPAYTIFRILSNKLITDYLFLLFLNPEMDRLGWFLSDSSVRSNLDWDRFCEIKITLPDIKIQKDIVAIYRSYDNRLHILNRLRILQKSICPILVKGSLKETSKEWMIYE